MRRDDGVRFAILQSPEKLLPRPGFDIARRVEFEADGACEIDVEADEHAILIIEIEGWEIAVGEEADDDAPGGSVSFLRPGLGISKRRERFRILRERQATEAGERHGQQYAEQSMYMRSDFHLHCSIRFGSRLK